MSDDWVGEDDVWDVAVVGAGPAGAAAAVAARRAWPTARVLLLDRADFPRDKACGDGVAPQVFDVLDRLGVHGVAQDLQRQGIVPVHHLRLGFGPDGAGQGPAVRGSMARPAYVVPRTLLDARLVAAAVDAGATLVKQRITSLVQRPRWVEVSGTSPVIGRGDGDGSRPVRARVVIGADGAHSRIRAALALEGPSGRDVAIAIRGYAPVAPGREDEQVIAFSESGAWPAYAWSFPIGDGRANVGYGEGLGIGAPTPRAAMLARLEELLPGTTADGVDWRGHHLPLSTGRVSQPDGRVLLAGDAMGMINPLTGEGIHAAVLSGALAGLAAGRAARLREEPAAGRQYRLALRAAFGRHHASVGLATRLGRGTLAGSGRKRRFVVAAGVRAAERDPRVFDDLVLMGLADGAVTPRVVVAAARELLT